MTANGAFSSLAGCHVELLRAAAVDVDVAVEAGVRTVTAADDLPHSMTWVAHRGGLPGLVIPWHRIDGTIVEQYRPDETVQLVDGPSRKYLWPRGVAPVLNVHPRMRARVGQAQTVVFVEGTKQYLAAVSSASADVLVVGLAGCYGWSSEGVPVSDLGRLVAPDVVVCFDADVASNRNVWDAASRFAEALAVLGTEQVRFVRLPASGSIGLDDFLAATDDPKAVFARLVERADKLGRAPAKKAASSSAPPEETEDVDTFDDVAHEAGWMVLDAVASFIRRFVVFADVHQVTAVTLWAAHTHCIEAADSTPRLSLQSAEKQSGKTRTLELLELLCRRPRHTASISAAALYRLVDAELPTLLIDEADSIWKPTRSSNDRNEDLRSLVNAGHRRGATVIRCVGEGAAQQAHEFPVFAPVALAGIGQLPDTIHDRSVIVRLRRRRATETVEPFRWRHHEPEARQLARRLAASATRTLDLIRDIEPVMPTGIVDRAADVWEPLLALADAAGGDWPDRARRACLELNAVRVDGDDSTGVRLLADLRAIFESAGTDRLFSSLAVEQLNALEEAQWSGWHRGGGFKQRDLAKVLRGFDVTSRDVRAGVEVRKGYHADDLADAWERYLPPDSPRGTATSATCATVLHAPTSDVADVADVADTRGHASGNGVDSDDYFASLLDSEAGS